MVAYIWAYGLHEDITMKSYGTYEYTTEERLEDFRMALLGCIPLLGLTIAIPTVLTLLHGPDDIPKTTSRFGTIGLLTLNVQVIYVFMFLTLILQ